MNTKVVPVEPTEEMVNAAWSVMFASWPWLKDSWRLMSAGLPAPEEPMVAAYKAMLAAAPAQPSEEGKDEPAAWRWRAKGATLWVYDPEIEWANSQGDAIEKQPLYARPAAELPPEHAGDLAKKIITELTDRSGFDAAWDYCDEEIKQEIIDTLRALIEGRK